MFNSAAAPARRAAERTDAFTASRQQRCESEAENQGPVAFGR
jgi:hypothetical protein